MSRPRLRASRASRSEAGRGSSETSTDEQAATCCSSGSERASSHSHTCAVSDRTVSGKRDLMRGRGAGRLRDPCFRVRSEECVLCLGIAATGRWGGGRGGRGGGCSVPRGCILGLASDGNRTAPVCHPEDGGGRRMHLCRLCPGHRQRAASRGGGEPASLRWMAAWPMAERRE